MAKRKNTAKVEDGAEIQEVTVEVETPVTEQLDTNTEIEIVKIGSEKKPATEADIEEVQKELTKMDTEVTAEEVVTEEVVSVPDYNAQLEYIIAPIKYLDVTNVGIVIKQLKKTGGEPYAIGEVAARAIAYLLSK
jgi:hypothetical protein